MTQILPNGIGASSGDVLVTSKDLQMAGTPYFVSSVIGDAGNDGLSRSDPMATIVAAYTAASEGDWIVLAADHSETLTGSLSLAKALTIVGEGSSGGFPTAQLINNQGSGSLITVDTADVTIANILFGAQTQACSAALVTCDQARFSVRGCKFEMDGNSDAAALSFATGGQHARVDSTTFLSTSTRQASASSNAPPVSGISIGAAMSGLFMNGTVFDGGEIGFSTYALDASGAVVTLVSAIGMSFLNGADYSFASGATGHLQIGTTSGNVVGSF